MSFEDTGIPGLWVFTPRKFEDDRGYFYESFNKQLWGDRIPAREFVQDNQSYSSRGTLRGLHLQMGEAAQSKLVRVVEGEVVDIVVDVRKNSPTYGKSYSVVLSAENAKQMYVPRGFAHGFCVLSETALFQYKCDNYYNAQAESGIRFDDPDLKLDWMLSDSEFSLSDKDKVLGSFKEVESGVNYED